MKTRFKFFIGTLVGALLFISCGNERPSTDMGYVDIERVTEHFANISGLHDVMELKLRAVMVKMDSLEVQAAKVQQAFETEASPKNQQELRSQMIGIRDQMAGLEQRAVETEQRILVANTNQLESMITDYCRLNGVEVLLTTDQESVLYHDQELDLTDSFLAFIEQQKNSES